MFVPALGRRKGADRQSTARPVGLSLYLTAGPDLPTFASVPRTTESPPQVGEVRVPTQVDTPPGAGVTKALSLLMIALMLAAIIYTASIAVRNWSAIAV